MYWILNRVSAKIIPRKFHASSLSKIDILPSTTERIHMEHLDKRCTRDGLESLFFTVKWAHGLPTTLWRLVDTLDRYDDTARRMYLLHTGSPKAASRLNLARACE